MNYIVFDLEFNQDFYTLQNFDTKGTKYPFEIIQIGAIKLDSEFNTVATFNHYIKPSIYTTISPFITELTGITTEQLLAEQTFPEVYQAYIDFIGDLPCIFCTWGISDMKELFKNVEYHQLSNTFLPRLFINLQPYVSNYLQLPFKNLLGLGYAVESLNIPLTYTFHNALYDAYYTAEIFEKIYSPSITPKVYDPHFIIVRPKRPKRQIDTDKLLLQFQKMYDREITEMEKEMILLSYKMGKTNQFLK